MAFLSVPSGSPLHQPLAFTDAAGAAIDLSTVTTLTLSIYYEATLLLAATVASGGITVINNAAGTARLDLTVTDTGTTLGAGEYIVEVTGIIAAAVTLLGRATLIITRTGGIL